MFKALISKGEQVRALVRDPQKSVTIQGPGVEPVVGDVGKPDSSDDEALTWAALPATL